MLGHHAMGAAAMGESPSGTTPSASGVITSQPVPNGQSQRFVGTTANATSGTVSLSPMGGGAIIGPTAFTITADAFDFTIDAIPAGSYTPTLTVTGAGGTGAVTGAQAFSILGVGGSGEIPGDTPGQAAQGNTVAITPMRPSHIKIVRMQAFY